MISRYCRCSGGDRGASAIEYGLIIAGTILGLLGIVVGLRTAIGTSYSSAECKIGSASGCTSPSPTTSPTGTTSPTSTPTGGPTTSVTSVGSSNLNPTLGETITLTATIVPATATGIVYFVDGTTAIGTATLVNGSATMSTSELEFGTHTITAVYTGSLGVTQSTSSAITVTVLRTTTVTLTFSPPAPVSGQTVVATATVTATPSSPTPAGSIRFTGPGIDSTVPLGGGSANLSLGALAVGSYAVAADYVPSDAISAPSSDSETLVVGQGSVSITVSVPGATTVPAGTQVTLRAQVAPSTATGTISFLRSTGGSPTTIGTAQLVNGLATLDTTTLPVGGWFIRATYGGDANYAAQPNSNSVTVTVVQAPGPVTNLRATPARRSVALAWTAPTGAPSPTRYIITRTPPAAGVRNTVTGTTFNSTGLSRNTNYQFTVVACVRVNAVDICSAGVSINTRTT